MGAGESTGFQLDANVYEDIQVKLDKKEPWYSPGETVSGTVSIGQQHFRKGSISLDLIGEIGYTMNYSTDTNSVRTAYRRLTFFTVSQPTITDGGKFEFRLDENLPPSINVDKDTYPYIRYAIQINLTRTNKHRHWIVVCPSITIPSNNIHPIHFDAFNRKQMRFIGSINFESILPGETFQFQYKILNPNQELIKSMDGNISMKAKIRGIEYNEKILDFLIDDVLETQENQIAGTLPITLPLKYYPPTFNYKDSNKSIYVHIEYFFTVDVHINGVNTSLRSSVPLIIGFQPDHITFPDLLSPERQKLSTVSMPNKRNSRKHRFHRFSHS